ncbi:MAG: zinc ribbon domain-containing protein [Nitrospinota bacterium]|nr:zinc ribbon domain-containing protein [Nitrospinota bacterium]
MPIFEYKHVDKTTKCRDPFEFITLAEKPLDFCPVCQDRVIRILSPFSHGKNHLSNSNLKDKGFSKFVRDGEGGYRKTT